mmetsp:Transcript_1939/g.5919  ORF Transcript_1939/g.5919 Transcript_1939/m.5919 type:complete len:203 (-) Transcript_1939:833-1441(-)
MAPSMAAARKRSGLGRVWPSPPESRSSSSNRRRSTSLAASACSANGAARRPRVGSDAREACRARRRCVLLRAKGSNGRLCRRHGAAARMTMAAPHVTKLRPLSCCKPLPCFAASLRVPLQGDLRHALASTRTFTTPRQLSRRTRRWFGEVGIVVHIQLARALHRVLKVRQSEAPEVAQRAVKACQISGSCLPASTFVEEREA